ncbi:Leucine-rich repeat-containing protein 1 [Geodia barretti]|uniref:Leucine-rich repeat-containing protein 1 n=1 Tax=Geodia barretti TaxID=519541 RepID=A0AA35SYB3_GEOBA|nr:Leucine-rich repeat-containing protein 1 [Geodia barretti]
MFKACIGLNCARTIDFIDHRHCSLTFIPDDVYRNEQTLEDLLLDCNMLQELPAKFFRLTNLRKLTLSENDLMRIPPNVANLTKLTELDISKNAIEELPTNMQFCRSLQVLDLSSNPLLRTPETLSSVTSLTELYINDVSIPSLPNEIGSLSNLRILESRENLLKSLPISIKNLKKLQRLDVGNNEIESLPNELGEMEELMELWLDDNSIQELPHSIVRLSNLVVLDITKNKVAYFPPGFSQLTSLSDLHASENCLEELPEDFGKLRSLHLVKLDYNHLRELPESIGELEHVTELLLYDNMLECLPPSLFHMKSLEMLNVDRNHIAEIPGTVGGCRTLHVLSLRENELTELPANLGQLEELTVLDVVGNRLNHLPLSVSNLHLDALWIDNSQSQPLVALHPDLESEPSVNKKLTCAYLPQQGPYSPSLENFMESDSMSEGQSVASSLPRDLEKSSSSKVVRMGVAFDPSSGPTETDQSSKLVRFPTPFRRDMNKKKKRMNKYKPGATPTTTIFKKGSSQDDLLSSLSSSTHEASPESNPAIKSSVDSMEVVTMQIDARRTESPDDKEIRHTSPGLAKMSGMHNLASSEALDQSKATDETSTTSDALKDAEYSYATEVSGLSQLQTVEVTIDLVKQPGRTLGFSIAGGRGSTPAYEDVDESIFVTKIASGGLAEQDGRLRLGDKLLKVNSVNMMNATHTEAVTVLKNVKEVCRMVVSREVLVVMPEEQLEKTEDSHTPTPTREDTATVSAVAVAGVPTSELSDTGASEEGRGFAKRIVAEILDRSVTKYRSSLIEGDTDADKKEESSRSDSAGPKSNYVNFDIAQTVIVSSREAGQEEEEEKAAANEDFGTEDREGSRTPTEANSSVLSPDDRDTLPSRTSVPAVHVMETSFDEDDYPTEKVILDRSVGKLGLSIIGGSEHASRIFGEGRPGVYISKITVGGAADASKMLRLGDRILSVNGQNVRHSTHQQVVQWLVSQQGNIELQVQHVPQPAGLEVIVIKKSASAKLGVSIKGGTKSTMGNPLDSNDKGIFVSKITAKGAVEKDGRLKVGQRILEINGTSLLGATHIVAVRALRSNPMEVSLLVCDGYDPREVVRREKEQERLSIGSNASATLDTSSLSSEASRSLDDAVRILSESMDALHTMPYASVRLSSKLSQSSAAIVDHRPVTAEDLDDVLKDLAEFNMGTSRSMKFMGCDYLCTFNYLFFSKETPDTSTPVPASESPAPPLFVDFTSALTSELYPLQSGDQLPLGLLGDDTPKPCESEKESAVDETEEFPQVQVEDTSSYLDQLDSEVSHLQDEVLEEENRLEEEGKEEKTEEPQGRRLTSQRSMPRIPVAEPNVQLTPETKRRIMKEIEINVESPKDEGQKKEAMDTLIGEVFDEVSFDEFEEQRSGRSSGRISGSLTPTTVRPASGQWASTDMTELLSALNAVGRQQARVEVAPAVPVVKLVAETQETRDTV